MTHQSLIDGRQSQALDLALSQQKPIKRITCFRQGIGCRHHMGGFDRQDRDPKCIKIDLARV